MNRTSDSASVEISTDYTEELQQKSDRMKHVREAIGNGDRNPVENNLILRYRKRPTVTMAVKANCFHCVGGTADDMPDPGWKAMIRNCTSLDCPLRAHRPYRGK